MEAKEPDIILGKKYRWLFEIEHGSFGTVYYCVNIRNNYAYAAKIESVSV